jgi:hypothetical protein
LFIAESADVNSYCIAYCALLGVLAPVPVIYANTIVAIIMIRWLSIDLKVIHENINGSGEVISVPVRTTLSSFWGTPAPDATCHIIVITTHRFGMAMHQLLSRTHSYSI